MSKRLALVAVLFLVALPAVARAHPPISVVMDRQGNVFYSDANRVWMVRPDGQKSIAVPNVHSHELFLDSAGNLYGDHLWYEGGITNKQWHHRVWKRSANGTISDVIPSTSGFRTDYSFVRDKHGNMYYAAKASSQQIRRRPPVGAATVFSPGPFTDIRSMVAGPDGTLYLIDSGDLKRVSPDGKVAVLARRLGTRSLARLGVDKRRAVMGLWLDSAQNVYAARYGSGDVKRISSSGEVATVAHSGLPWGPTGGLAAPNGDLWILESSIINEVRLKRISKDGAVTYY